MSGSLVVGNQELSLNSSNVLGCTRSYRYDGNCELVYNVDGSLSTRPKGLAYIVGEHLIRPAIDGVSYCARCLVNVVNYGIGVVDHRVGQLFQSFPSVNAVFNFIPVANAQDLTFTFHNSNNGGLTEGSRKPLKKLGDLKDFVVNLEQQHRNALESHQYYIEGYKKAVAIKEQLDVFVMDMVSAENKFMAKYEEHSQNLNKLHDELIDVSTDIQLKGWNSKYAPNESINVKLNLIYPKYVIYQTANDQDLKLSIEPGALLCNEQDLLKKHSTQQKTSTHKEWLCNAIKDEIYRGGDLEFDLLYNVNPMMEFKDFIGMIEPSKIERLKNVLEIKKNEIKKWFKEQISYKENDLFAKKTNEMRDRIQTKIDDIYKKHQQMVRDSKKDNPKHSYEINSIESSGHVIQWDIIEKATKNVPESIPGWIWGESTTFKPVLIQNMKFSFWISSDLPPKKT